MHPQVILTEQLLSSARINKISANLKYNQDLIKRERETPTPPPLKEN